MTIKEIEDRSGMTRANIRFYEAEGLLAPARLANRYRDYSEEDLEVLKKIRLLRSLRIPLEEIRELHEGRKELPDTLKRQLSQLRGEKEEIEHAQALCEVMSRDGVRYQTLDAQRYLDAWESRGWTIPQPDAISEAYVPWRRYFARSMDLLLCSLLWELFLTLVLNVNILQKNAVLTALDAAVPLLSMLLLEPFLLTLFAATPGKWLLGLRVTDDEGRRLSYEQARTRTRKVLLYGLGLNLPVYGLFRLWKSYKAYSGRESLEWEYRSVITLKSDRVWRIAALLGVLALSFASLNIAYRKAAWIPKNRGEITVAQFCQNYNRFSKFYGLDTESRLNAKGQWIPSPQREGVAVVGQREKPAFVFTENDRGMTGVSFRAEIVGEDRILSGDGTQMFLSVLAFVGAQEENRLFSDELAELLDKVNASPFDDFEFTLHGVRISCDVEYSGYQKIDSMGILFPEEGARHSYSVTFSLQKQERETVH